MIKDHIKFASDILVRLGEELVPNVDQGILELVKNAYDADASTCCIELISTDILGGAIRITDDGDGMNLASIRNGWLVLGQSTKEGARRTKLGRLPVGDKGLGRLAALRMGSEVNLVTRPKSQLGAEHRVLIDWTKYKKATLVEDVPLTIETVKTSKGKGTEILLTNLHIQFGHREVNRLARNLILLTNPFNDAAGFRPILKAPGFEDLENKVRESYFPDAEFKLEAVLDKKGKVEARLRDWKGDIWKEAKDSELSKQVYKAPAAKFDLWIFLLDAKSFSARKVSITEVRDWLSLVGGVHLYHRGLRVHPYGDPGFDWLDMNLSRARSPENRPSTNTVIGRIEVTDPRHDLIQKTDRVGFIENREFSELRRFARDTLEWVADVREKEAEKKREQYRVETRKEVVEAKRVFEDVIDAKVPDKIRPIVREAFHHYHQIVDRRISSIGEDLQLYRSLATAGTTTAVFAHESAKPVTLISKVTDFLESNVDNILGLKHAESLTEPISILRYSIKSLRSFTALPMYLLKKSKRRVEQVPIHDVLEQLANIFLPLLEEAHISLQIEKGNFNPTIHGSVALIEAIVTNCLTNSINAFNSPAAPNNNRLIVIRTEQARRFLLLRIMDNGPGITELKLNEIWLPGRTTTNGTGFGLTIVKDAVSDLGGRIEALAHGELGGAEFIVSLPISEV